LSLMVSILSIQCCDRDMPDIFRVIRTHDGFEVILSRRTWMHIITRHPELKGKAELISDAVSNPDEVYLDKTQARHAIKKVDLVSDYLVVIYRVDGKGYIITAYFISSRRKRRRYRWFKKLTRC